MATWYQQFYDDIDNLRMEEYLAAQTEDATVVVGNGPKVMGRQQIRAGIGGFWGKIGGLRHRFFNVIESGDFTVLEAHIDYTRKDGRVVTVPCTTVLKRRDSLISETRIYIDLAPVFAPAS